MVSTLGRLIPVIFLLTLFCSAASADRRVALVIGNSGYSHVERLKNPRNDAEAIAKALKSIGFDKVTLKLDLPQSALNQALGQFSRDAAGADISLIYYAGHGIEVGGTNYLVPTDASLGHVDVVTFQTVPLHHLMSAMYRTRKLKLVILDACRNNPFKQKMAGIDANRGVGRGFARVDARDDNTFVAFAAKAGTVADDGDGRNSPFTTALLKHITTAGVDVRFLFGKVRDEVIRSTGRLQEPAIYGSLGGDPIYLRPPEKRETPKVEAAKPVPAEPLAAKPKPQGPTAATVWPLIKDTTSPAILQTFIDRFPTSFLADVARARKAELEKLAEEKLAALRPRTEPAPVPEQPKEAPPRPSDDLSGVIARVLPGVVTVKAYSKTIGIAPGNALEPAPDTAKDKQFKEFFEEFFKDKKRSTRAITQRNTKIGTGFVVSKEGHILTAQKLVDGTDAIEVTLDNGRRLDGKIVGMDAKTGMALLKVSATTSLTPLVFAERGSVRLGQRVFSVGNLNRLSGTVSRGSITGLNRDLNAGPYDQYLQTDQSFIDSQAGSPLFNAKGNVIGMIVSTPETDKLKGKASFAVPSSILEAVATQLAEFGETRRGWLGVKIQTVTDDMASSLGLDRAKGAMVADVTANGPAAKAGMKAGDVILSVDGKPVGTMRELPRMIASYRPHSRVTIKVFRKGSEERLQVALGLLPKAAPPAKPAPKLSSTSRRKLLGMTVGPITADLREKHKIKPDVRGIVVLDVDPDSSAAEKRIRAGTVIVEAGAVDVRDAKHFSDLARNGKRDGNKSMLILVNDIGNLRFLALKLPESISVTAVPDKAPPAAAAAKEADGDMLVKRAKAQINGDGTITRDVSAAADNILKAYAKFGNAEARRILENGAAEYPEDFRKAIQEKLKTAGHYNGSIDGKLGQGTLRALRQYRDAAR